MTLNSNPTEKFLLGTPVEILQHEGGAFDDRVGSVGVVVADQASADPGQTICRFRGMRGDWAVPNAILGAMAK